MWFKKRKMLFNKQMMLLVLFLAVTGLPLLSLVFSWIARTVGIHVSWFIYTGPASETLAAGVQVMRLVHWFAAVLLTLNANPFVLLMLRQGLSWPPSSDRREYACQEADDAQKEKVPFGNFETGQKISDWLVTFCIVTLLCTGWLLLWREAVGPDAVAFARMLHSIFFILTMVTMILPIYFSTHPINAAAFKARIRSGEMDLEYVKIHHPYWYERIMRRKGK